MTESHSLDARKLAPDAILLLLIPLLLTLLHFFLPGSIHDALVFEHRDLNPVTMWTSAYVHRSNSHLFGNVIAYFITLLPTYVLYLYWDRRRTFWQLVAIALLAFPLLISISDYLIFSYLFDATATAATRGFSGIDSAFGGILLASLGLFLADRYDRETSIYALESVMLVLLGVLLVTFVQPTPLFYVGAVCVGLIGTASAFVSRSWVREPGAIAEAVATHQTELTLVICATVALVWLVQGMFPAELISDGSFTNIFGHASGFVLGVIGAITLMFSHSI